MGTLELPDLGFRPKPYDCPLFDGKCGQSLNDYFNIAIEQYINEHYDKY